MILSDFIVIMTNSGYHFKNSLISSICILYVSSHITRNGL